MSHHIVIVDDEEENLIFLSRVLKEKDVITFTSPAEALEYFKASVDSAGTAKIDLVITDQKMPGMTGLELVKKLISHQKSVPCIIVSAYTDPDDLIDAVNSRLIYQYVVKPYDPSQIINLVDSALDWHDLQRKNVPLPQDPLSSFRGISEETNSLREKARFYAQSDSPLFICGDSGTGKEVLSRAIHRVSPRSTGPFVAVNCGALAKDLFISEMFGHVKGAFSGAQGEKRGFVRQAQGGTLFLDEVSDIPREHQAALLRFIQFSTYYPVGSTQEERVDVRIISASHLNLKVLRDQGIFREDLYYRLSGFQLHISPLKGRPEDTAFLLMGFLEQQGIHHGAVEKSVWDTLVNYPWKGNVRELIHACEKASLIMKMRNSSILSAEMLPEIVDPADLSLKKEPEEELTQKRASGEPFNLNEYLGQIEDRIITEVYLKQDKNISRTAAALELSRQGLKNKLKRLGFLPDRRESETFGEH